MFKKRHSIEEVEEGKYLSPKFDENGLIPVVTSDYKNGDILMHGYMNQESLKKTKIVVLCATLKFCKMVSFFVLCEKVPFFAKKCQKCQI